MLLFMSDFSVKLQLFPIKQTYSVWISSLFKTFSIFWIRLFDLLYHKPQSTFDHRNGSPDHFFVNMFGVFRISS